MRPCSVHLHALIILAVLEGTVSLTGQTKPAFDVYTNGFGPTILSQTNYGITAYNVKTYQAGLKYPQYNGHQYVFGSGLWMSGIVAGGQSKSVLISFDPTSGQSCMTPGELSNGNELREDLTDRYAVGVETQGDMEVLTSLFHSGDTSRFTSLSKQIPMTGLQFMQKVYRWKSSAGDLSNVVLLRTWITNTTTDPIYAFSVAWIVDPDIGNPNATIDASRRDDAWFVKRKPHLGLAAVISHPGAAETKPPGALGLAYLACPQGSYVGTFLSRSIVTFGYESAEEAYADLHSNVLEPTPQPADVLLAINSVAIDVFEPGETIETSMAYMVMPAEAAAPAVAAGSKEVIESYFVNLAEQVRNKLPDLTTFVTEDASPVPLSLAVMPNPAGDRFVLQTECTGSCVIEIIDLAGRLVWTVATHGDQEVSGPTLPGGMYHVTLRQGPHRITRSLVILH